MSALLEEPQVQERAILVDPETNARYRVIQNEGSHAWLMRIGDGDWPTRVHRIFFSKFHVEPPKPGKELSANVWAAARATHERFKTPLADITKLLSPNGRTAAFDAMKTTDKKLSSKTFYRVIRAWLEGGCTLAALATSPEKEAHALTRQSVEGLSEQFARTAAQTQRDRLLAAGYTPPDGRDHIVSGMPRKRDQPLEPSMFRVDANALRVFLPYFEKKKCGATLPDLYDEMIADIFNQTNAAGESVPVPKWAHPSFGAFETWYYKTTSFRTRNKNQRGQKHVNLKGRSKLGTLISDAYGAVCDLDATIWNVELVSEDEEARLIGPAVVFRIRCKSSGQLVGIDISLDSASWMGAASTISSCMEPKDLLCARNGIAILASQWNACGLPGTIRADCGETHNSKPTPFIALTGVSIINLQPGRGDLKGGVESDFFVLQTSLNGKTPGAIIKEYEDLTDTKWRVKARLTLKQFMNILLLEELKRMHTPRDRFQLPEALSGLGVGTSPSQVWNAGIRYMAGGLKGGFDKSEVELSLMERGKAAVTEEGLLFKTMLFQCDEHIRTEAYERARAKGRRTVDAAFDPRLVDQIYVIEGDVTNPTKYHKAELMTHLVDQRDLIGRGFREALQIRSERRTNDLRAQEQAQANIDQWSRQQRATVAQAQERVTQARIDHPISNHALMQQRGEAREHERAATSPQRAFRPEVPAEGTDPFPIVQPSEAPQPLFAESAAPATAPPPPASQIQASASDKAARMRRRAEGLMKSKPLEVA